MNLEYTLESIRAGKWLSPLIDVGDNISTSRESQKLIFGQTGPEEQIRPYS
jgi:hypothetical protein